MEKQFNALEYLKNRIITLSLNHKIGSRDIAKQEVKEIVMGIKTHVIPTLEKALERAKKIEELLGLYQKRFSFYNFDEDKDLREIKQLEKELDKDV